jgi:hypothetical protein
MRKLILICITATIFACSSDLEDPDAVPEDQKLQIYTTKSSLVADTRDTTRVFCRLPVDAGRTDIIFTTSKGAFLESNALTVKQYADSVAGNYRFAAVTLRSDTSRTLVFITAETGTSRKRISIIFN